MQIIHWFLIGFIIIGLIYWIFQLALVIRITKTVPVLMKLNPPEPYHWPKVSVIMPGRNEEHEIERALRSRLSDDYPNLELIMVEDRSTDQTPRIVDRLSAENPALKVVHITELPRGWLGKLYAMDQGCKIASGDWLLFSDADVHISSGAMKKAIAYAESKKLDHLALLPDMLQEKNPFLNLILCNALRLLLVSLRIWDVENPKKDTGVGMGSFNLVRRSSFSKTAGFEWLKLEVSDDVALGYMMKKSGGKCSMANGTGLVGVHLYHSFREMFIGTEKAIFSTIGNFSLSRMIFLVVIILLLEYSPFIALARINAPFFQIMGVAMVAISILTHLVGNIWTKRPLGEAFLWYLSTPLFIFGFVRAGVLGKLRGDIIWKGTHYSIQELKEGKRLKL